jgi:hypothetical protein
MSTNAARITEISADDSCPEFDAETGEIHAPVDRFGSFEVFDSSDRFQNTLDSRAAELLNW